jgi:hypothetical protein
MKLFVTTTHCTYYVHCKACLSSPAFRSQLAERFDLTHNGKPMVDGVCPVDSKITLDNLPKPVMPAAQARTSSLDKCEFSTCRSCSDAARCKIDGGECTADPKDCLRRREAQKIGASNG